MQSMMARRAKPNDFKRLKVILMMCLNFLCFLAGGAWGLDEESDLYGVTNDSAGNDLNSIPLPFFSAILFIFTRPPLGPLVDFFAVGNVVLAALLSYIILVFAPILFHGGEIPFPIFIVIEIRRLSIATSTLARKILISASLEVFFRQWMGLFATGAFSFHETHHSVYPRLLQLG